MAVVKTKEKQVDDIRYTKEQLLKAKQHFVELYVNYCMIRYYMKKFLQLMIQ